MISKIGSNRLPIQRLELHESGKEGLLIGVRKNGVPLSVRKHRKHYLMPDTWKKLIETLPTDKVKLTAEILIQTGARINEVRHIEERDIDYDRNTVRLRVVKTKARKKGEERGAPRTIPMNSDYIKKLRKHFRDIPVGKEIGILTTSAFRIAMQKALEEIGVEDWYMYSAHSIRKTHGNWLKIMGNLRMMSCDANEICLRLGHDYNTFLKDYGSSGVMNSADVLIIKEILGDLYANRMI